MTRPSPKRSEYVNVYLPMPLYDYLNEHAVELNLGMSGAIREILLEACPPHIAEQARRAIAMSSTKEPCESEAVHQQPKQTSTVSKPKAEPPPARPQFDELVDKYRDRVRDLEARGYTENAIAGIVKIPFRVVQEILTTPAKPKKKEAR